MFLNLPAYCRLLRIHPATQRHSSGEFAHVAKSGIHKIKVSTTTVYPNNNHDLRRPK
jgi:hypothetical protein